MPPSVLIATSPHNHGIPPHDAISCSNRISCHNATPDLDMIFLAISLSQYSFIALIELYALYLHLTLGKDSARILEQFGGAEGFTNPNRIPPNPAICVYLTRGAKRLPSNINCSGRGRTVPLWWLSRSDLRSQVSGRLASLRIVQDTSHK